MDACKVLTLLLVVSVAHCNRKFRNPYHCGEDFKLFNPPYVMDTVEVESLSTCEDLCDSTEGCEAFNYEYKSTRTCELCETVTDKWGLDMKNGDGFDYFIKEDEEDEASQEACAEATVEKQQEVIALSEGVTLFSTDNYWGWWCKDPIDKNPNRTYYSKGYENVNTFYEFATEEDAKANRNQLTHTVKDVRMDGAQQVVYGRRLYYKMYNRRMIYVYDIDNDRTHGRISDLEAYGSTYAGYSACQYQVGKRSDIDMATDESGLWVIWGRQDDDCHVSISKIDPDTLTVTRTWHLYIDKNTMNNAFIAHGIFYGYYNRGGNNDGFKYMYNTRNDSLTSFYSDEAFYSYLRFPNIDNVMYMNYNPVEKVLYTTENKQNRRYSLTFRDVN